MQGVHKSSLKCLFHSLASTDWKCTHKKYIKKGKKTLKADTFSIKLITGNFSFFFSKQKVPISAQNSQGRKLCPLRLFEQYMQLWVIYKLVVPALPTENRKAFYLYPRYHFYSKEYKRMHQKVNTRVIKGCMKSMLYLYRTHYCLLANSFFSPLRILKPDV